MPYTKVVHFNEMIFINPDATTSFNILSGKDFNIVLPLLIGGSDSYVVENSSDGFFNYADIRYNESNKRQRIFYNLKTFPCAAKFDIDCSTDKIHLAHREYVQRLAENVIEFLPDQLPTIREKVSFLRETFIKETIENAIQSAFAIEQRLDREKNKNHDIEYYQELSERGLLEGILEISYQYDILNDGRRAYIVTIKNYGKECDYHINRIKKRIGIGADNSYKPMDAFIEFEQEIMREPSSTGNGGSSIFMAKKGLKEDKALSADLYFKFVPLRNNLFASGFGAYEFNVIIPCEKEKSIN